MEKRKLEAGNLLDPKKTPEKKQAKITATLSRYSYAVGSRSGVFGHYWSQQKPCVNNAMQYHGPMRSVIVVDAQFTPWISIKNSAIFDCDWPFARTSSSNQDHIMANLFPYRRSILLLTGTAAVCKPRLDYFHCRAFCTEFLRYRPIAPPSCRLEPLSPTSP